MKNQAKFWNRIAKMYSKKSISNEEAYKKKLEVTQKYLGPQMEVLEFGCGTGSTAIIHSPFVKHIQAIDISTEMIKIAKEKAAEQDITNVSFECSNFEELNLQNSSLDAVMGLSILHLLEDKEKIMEKVYDALRPGGVFITSTICISDSLKFLKFILPLGHSLGLIPIVISFTGEELENSFKDAGFKIDYKWRPNIKEAVFIIAKK